MRGKKEWRRREGKRKEVEEGERVRGRDGVSERGMKNKRGRRKEGKKEGKKEGRKERRNERRKEGWMDGRKRCDKRN